MTAAPSLMAGPRPLACDECPPGGCQFSRGRVYFYLTVMRQAVLVGAPFESVLRACTRSSRTIDPWLRGGGRGEAYATTIGLTLVDVGRRHDIDITNPHNADRIAALVCPERWEEVVADVDGAP